MEWTVGSKELTRAGGDTDGDRMSMGGWTRSSLLLLGVNTPRTTNLNTIDSSDPGVGMGK